jgi:hypothetical protein
VRRVPDKAIKAAYEKHGGVIRYVARELGRAESTVAGWCRQLGLKGKGKGGNKDVLFPPDDEMRALYDKHCGVVSRVSEELGRSIGGTSTRLNRLGLYGKGKERYRGIYPTEIQAYVSDGYVVIYSDFHAWPTVLSPAYKALLAVLKKLKPAYVIGNGDLLDGARISRFDPIGWDDLPTLEEELVELKERCYEVEQASPSSEKIAVIGNHDARFEKYVIKYASELEGVPGMRLGDHFPNWQVCWSVKINDDVMVKHRFRGGIHATWNNVLHAGITVVTGHLHSQNTRPKTDYRGTRWGVDAGCLADPRGPQFRYTENNPVDWRAGFCVLQFEGGVLRPPMLATVLDDGAVYLQRNERIL